MCPVLLWNRFDDIDRNSLEPPQPAQTGINQQVSVESPQPEVNWDNVQLEQDDIHVDEEPLAREVYHYFLCLPKTNMSET
jgi:hypothetical protein